MLLDGKRFEPNDNGIMLQGIEKRLSPDQGLPSAEQWGVQPRRQAI